MSNKVVVISKEQCMKCNMTKKFLESKGIDFEYRVIDPYTEENSELIEKFRDAGFGAFPVVFPRGMEDWSDAWCDYRINHLRELVTE